jgi:hypothetical protein
MTGTASAGCVEELTEAIADRTGPWAVERTMEAFQGMWPRWRQLTSTAAHRGMLCSGPGRGRKVTYTNPHRWLPGLRPADGDAALRTLVTRYLYAYGPATPLHFAKWLGSGAPAGKLAITVEPLRDLTAPHRRQLDDEVDLVGAVMEATATLTVGTVMVGPHA